MSMGQGYIGHYYFMWQCSYLQLYGHTQNYKSYRVMST